MFKAWIHHVGIIRMLFKLDSDIADQKYYEVDDCSEDAANFPSLVLEATPEAAAAKRVRRVPNRFKPY